MLFEVYKFERNFENVNFWKEYLFMIHLFTYLNNLIPNNQKVY